MLEYPEQEYSLKKHTDYKGFRIECPYKFCTPELDTECIKDKCAFWMPIQRACAINVQARILDDRRK